MTGFPEIMDGRVKTLHPAVHSAILARRGRNDDMATLGQHKITPIDIVVVNLYPFVKATATPGIAFGALVEEIDIGGPSMVRSAAKNFQDLLIVVDPARLSARAVGARASGWRVERVPLRAREKSVCAYGSLRHRHCRNLSEFAMVKRDLLVPLALR